MEQESKECRSTDSNEYGLVSIPLQVGQVWSTYGDQIITLTDYDPKNKTFQSTNDKNTRTLLYKYDGSCNTIFSSDILKELITLAPAFEEGQVWLRANGAKVHLRKNSSTLKAYFMSEPDDCYTGFSAEVEWFKPDEGHNLVKLLKQAPVKPPLGLRPRYIAIEGRIGEIESAIARYKKAGIPIPQPWTAELKELVATRTGLLFDKWWDNEGSKSAFDVLAKDEIDVNDLRILARFAWDNKKHEADASEKS